jgi:hypothetical protein
MKFIFALSVVTLFINASVKADTESTPPNKSPVLVKKKVLTSKSNKKCAPNNPTLSEEDIKRLMESATSPKARRIVRVDQDYDIIYFEKDKS